MFVSFQLKVSRIEYLKMCNVVFLSSIRFRISKPSAVIHCSNKIIIKGLIYGTKSNEIIMGYQ